jgi:hypothetical protein
MGLDFLSNVADAVTAGREEQARSNGYFVVLRSGPFLAEGPAMHWKDSAVMTFL